MNSRKNLILGFAIIFLLSFIIPTVNAQTGTYEQRISQANPFMFGVDTIYTMSAYDYRMQNDSFHQAILDGDIYYVFYIKSSLVSYNLTVWIQISDASESYFREDCRSGEYQLLMIFKPQTTGLYNITLSNRNYDTIDDLFFKVDEIGIIEVPAHIFYYNSGLGRNEVHIIENWDSEYLVFGIVHLERFKVYKIQAGLEIYKGYLLQYSLGSEKLDGNNPLEEQYLEDDILNVTSEGDYLFYELLGNPFLIHYQDVLPQTPNIIGGYSLLLIGIISLTYIFIIAKRRFN